MEKATHTIKKNTVNSNNTSFMTGIMIHDGVYEPGSHFNKMMQPIASMNYKM